MKLRNYDIPYLIVTTLTVYVLSVDFLGPEELAVTPVNSGRQEDLSAAKLWVVRRSECSSIIGVQQRPIEHKAVTVGKTTNSPD